MVLVISRLSVWVTVVESVKASVLRTGLNARAPAAEAFRTYVSCEFCCKMLPGC